MELYLLTIKFKIMDITKMKQEIRGVKIQVEETLEDTIEDGVQMGTHYIFITDEYGNEITIEDGMIKSGSINGKEFYNEN
tara:strand:+ start:1760 stop:1999 length:240 start_codon:yes stop_codon:yes gene_type:complete